MSQKLACFSVLACVGTIAWTAEVSAYAVPEYNPSFWNASGVVEKNNCYNYAMNVRSTTAAAQPGTAHFGYQKLTSNDLNSCNVVASYAYLDGTIGGGWEGFLYGVGMDVNAACGEPGMTKVALVIWPGWDYHWYRRDNDGWWSEKAGLTPADDLDAWGWPIADPQTANRGPYTLFCGYFCTGSTSWNQGTGVMTIH
jgi:hypothetical protein